MFKSEDFQSTKISLSIKNESTTTAPRKDGSNDKIESQLIEISEKGVVLELPKNSCNVGHNIFIIIDASKSEKKAHFECTGKVTHCELLDTNIQRVNTEFLKYSKVNLEKFLEFFESEQNAALELFQSIRGY